MTEASKFAAAPLRPDQSLFWLMAIKDGQLYAAPLGTPLDLNTGFGQTWLRVDSADDLRGFFGAGS